MKRIYRIPVLIVAISTIALLSACKGKNDPASVPDGDQNTNFAIVVTDTIVVDVPASSYNTFQVTYLYENRYLYGVNLNHPLKIDVIDLEEVEFIGSINIDRNIFNTFQVSNLVVQSPDSIFFLSNERPVIFLIDGNGQMIDKWDEGELKVLPESDQKLSVSGFGFSSASYLESPWYDSGHNYLYLKINPVSWRDAIGDTETCRHGIYDLNKRQWVSIFGPYEGVLREKGAGRYYADMHDAYQLVTEGFIFVTYPVDHHVYGYDTSGFELVKVMDCGFPAEERFPEPLYGKDAEDLSKLIELRQSTPFWGPLQYHDNVGLYSRFYNHAAERGKRSIVIYDQDLNFVYSEKFNLDDISKIIPTPDGFVTLVYNESARLDADHLMIRRLRLVTL